MSTMGSIKTDRSKEKRRRAWKPPVVTKVAIDAQTKSALPGDERPGLAEPQPPSSPATKLGFSFEMAFPLAARSKK
jgi:hypothetical protein